MCEVASNSSSQSMALAKVGSFTCESFHCFSLTLSQVHNALGLVSSLDGKSRILLYLILYHILVVLFVPWIINIEPPSLQQHWVVIQSKFRHCACILFVCLLAKFLNSLIQHNSCKCCVWKK